MPKRVDKGAKRTEILENALIAFAEKGYQKSTVRYLAKKMGVTTGVLYHYFSGKEQLFQRLVEYIQERQLRRFLSVFPITDSTDIPEYLGMFMDEFRIEWEQIFNIECYPHYSWVQQL